MAGFFHLRESPVDSHGNQVTWSHGDICSHQCGKFKLQQPPNSTQGGCGQNPSRAWVASGGIRSVQQGRGQTCQSSWYTDMGMDQYLLIPILGGWTSIYQLFWCSPGVQGFDTLPYIQLYWEIGIPDIVLHLKSQSAMPQGCWPIFFRSGIGLCEKHPLGLIKSLADDGPILPFFWPAHVMWQSQQSCWIYV